MDITLAQSHCDTEVIHTNCVEYLYLIIKAKAFPSFRPFDFFRSSLRPLSVVRVHVLEARVESVPITSGSPWVQLDYVWTFSIRNLESPCTLHRPSKSHRILLNCTSPHQVTLKVVRRSGLGYLAPNGFLFCNIPSFNKRNKRERIQESKFWSQQKLFLII
jgi:hypothetical protein